MSAWLAAAYAMLTLGLAWALIGGGGWKRRIPYIVCAPALGIALWLDRPNPAGWPTTGKVPGNASLVSAVVDAPDPATSDPGRIYLWLDDGSGRPRAYALPYSRALHERVQRALRTMQRGRQVSVGRAGRRAPAGHGSARGSHEPGSVVRFYPTPPQVLPPKVR